MATSTDLSRALLADLLAQFPGRWFLPGELYKLHGARLGLTYHQFDGDLRRLARDRVAVREKKDGWRWHYRTASVWERRR